LSERLRAVATTRRAVRTATVSNRLRLCIHDLLHFMFRSFSDQMQPDNSLPVAC
jgi:hypothetical protein